MKRMNFPGVLVAFTTLGALAALEVMTVVAAPEPADAPVGLAFEKERIDLKVKVDDETATAVFPFTNHSGREIRIEDVHTNCGCVRAGADNSAQRRLSSYCLRSLFLNGIQHAKCFAPVS